jgi:DNA-binding SARP family transcriptional activator/TolB-like protein
VDAKLGGPRLFAVSWPLIAGQRRETYIRGAMIELSLLGPHALHGSDGRELTSLPAQPKRFALLAYLAIGGAGYRRRDTLTAVFWPDLDQFAARRALRNTLYHLREALGNGVIVTRGDDAVSINPDMLTCDVTRLADAVTTARYEEALDCYRGELLAGMHFVSAGEAFEDWLTQERLRVKDLLMRALRGLVEREESSGNLPAAAAWAQRACAMAPGDESWLRRAMALLDQTGDTGGALRLYEALSHQLTAEFGATPSAETRDLASRIRAGGWRPAAAADPAPVPSPGGNAPPVATASAAAPAPRRRRAAVWIGLLTVMAIGALWIVRSAKAGHAPAPAARTRVLVAVFDNRTGDATLQSLGRMTQDWIAQGILRTELVDVVDPHAVYVQGHTTSGAPDPIMMARRTGAALAISGSYYRTGDTLFVQAAVLDVPTGRVLRVVGPVLSSVHTPVAALDELRSRVMTALASAVDLHPPPDLGGELPPFDAYRDYVDGWDAFWHGDGQRAKLLFLRAAHRDTAFTAAALSAASTGANYHDCPLVDSLSRALNARGETLDRRERLAIQVADAFCRGRNDEMLRLALERADLEPSNSSAQMPAAAAALWADRPARSLEILKRVNPAIDLGWSTDTVHFNYWGDVTEAFHLLGRHAEELAAAGSMPAGAPLGQAWMRCVALAALRRPTAALALLDSSLSLPVETASNIGLAPYTDGRPEYVMTPAWVANWVARELAVHGDTVASRQAAMRAMAWYRSRPAAERATMEERLVAAWSLEMLGSYGEAERIARQLVAEDSANVDFRGELASLAAERHETALADSLDRWLAGQPVSRVSWSASVYRARVAALLGRFDDAVARTRETLDDGAWPYWLHVDPAFVPLQKRADFVALMAPRD